MLVEQVATIAAVAGSEFELEVEPPADDVPADEDVEEPAGGSAWLCVAEHPATAMSALAIAAAAVTRGRNRLVIDECLSLAPQAHTLRYGTAASAP